MSNLAHVLLCVVAYAVLTGSHVRGNKVVAAAYGLLLLAVVLAYLL